MNCSVEVEDGEDVRGILDEGAETGFAFSQLFTGDVLTGEVCHEAHVARGGGAVCVVKRSGVDGEIEAVAVFAEDADIFASPETGLGKFGRDRGLLADDFGCGKTSGGFGERIPVENLARGVEDLNRERRFSEGLLKQGAGIEFGGFSLFEADDPVRNVVV